MCMDRKLLQWERETDKNGSILVYLAAAMNEGNVKKIKNFYYTIERHMLDENKV